MMLALASASAGSGFTVTADMFSGLVSAIKSNAEVLIPIGISIMAIMVGISLIPRIFYKFI